MKKIISMTKSESTRREKLRKKMCSLQDEAQKFRRQIEHIDKKYEQAERDKIAGKCFALKRKHDDKICGYARVEFFAEHDYKPSGTEITWYGNGDKRILTINFNHWIFEDYIKNGKKISHNRFNKYLKMAQSMIKFK